MLVHDERVPVQGPGVRCQSHHFLQFRKVGFGLAVKIDDIPVDVIDDFDLRFGLREEDRAPAKEGFAIGQVLWDERQDVRTHHLLAAPVRDWGFQYSTLILRVKKQGKNPPGFFPDGRTLKNTAAPGIYIGTRP